MPRDTNRAAGQVQFDWMTFQTEQRQEISKRMKLPTFTQKTSEAGRMQRTNVIRAPWLIRPSEHAQGHLLSICRPLAWGGYHDRTPDIDGR
jgi:hypothetical protein